MTTLSLYKEPFPRIERVRSEVTLPLTSGQVSFSFSGRENFKMGHNFLRNFKLGQKKKTYFKMGLKIFEVLSNVDIRSFLPLVRPISSIFFRKFLECPFGRFAPTASLLSASNPICNSLSTHPPLCLLPIQLQYISYPVYKLTFPPSFFIIIFFSPWFSSSHPQPPRCSHFISHGLVLVWNGMTQVNWV